MRDDAFKALLNVAACFGELTLDETDEYCTLYNEVYVMLTTALGLIEAEGFFANHSD